MEKAWKRYTPVFMLPTFLAFIIAFALALVLGYIWQVLINFVLSIVGEPLLPTLVLDIEKYIIKGVVAETVKG